jgi:hypothetical protein
VPTLKIPEKENDSSDIDENLEPSARGVGIEEFNGLEQFSKYKEMFFDLTKRSFVDTGNFDCVQIILTYDSKHCVVLLTEDDTKWHI